ncbi:MULTISPECIES: phosphate signaling complex PhoU family protein [Psychrilyobacter]|uniref:Phosphate uptake regulator PhoU n=1 Tax=Psychrilyobacter piezotolerans TaxID=2293438 RepID=A0ABX9KEJ2_9FUSO|nr:MULTISPECIES: PhoU domain-containing protein [Psychrilyobacter]MCS5421950.1 phosphate uptake regulator PhoU [Psychrilyobacter sp. S5]NDI78968.1 phosphate uptake regulator PhoU [Psychrilyobacter piezotolerans]RDE59260.1 phosphate uptake regulator PhoU [Psychrilyobacter sp. S5]REI39820.1 phosphate uptake regulator PhoU [Psychrilyobacter piezotolerans]
MKNLHERIDSITEQFVEMFKNVDRLFKINMEMLEKRVFIQSLYGEAKVVEDRINAYEVKIREDSILAIVRFQPAARDLRALLTFIDCVKMLERMGDLLKNNLRLMRKLNKDGNGTKEHICIIEEMANKVHDIFETYMQAFIERDEKKIYTLLACDEEIDEMRIEVVNEIIDFMKESPENIEGGSIILLLSKKFERLSDKIMQLGKGLIYTMSGENLRKQELEK